MFFSSRSKFVVSFFSTLSLVSLNLLLSSTTLSESFPIRAIISPTGTTSLTLNKISITFPLAGEGTSESTLSVDISNKVSSLSIISPTCFFHSKMVPSVIDSPSLGITTFTDIKSPIN